MMPVVDKPLIQYAVEEAVAAGITQLIFVTSSSKRAIEDHFDSNFELESALSDRGQSELLAVVRGILPEGVSCVYVRQKSPMGLGHAVLCAKDLIMNEPFAVLLADDLIDGGDTPCLAQMADAFRQTGSSMVAVQDILPEESPRYGVVELTASSVPGNPVIPLRGIVEKPRPEKALSRLGVVGRYILTPQIFAELEQTARGSGGELQLTDAIARLIQKESVNAFRFAGRRFDCGSKLGYLEATMACALKHPELAADFRTSLRKFAECES
jgi:UTP--glucose-1-phosphate uridylyltransferase